MIVPLCAACAPGADSGVEDSEDVQESTAAVLADNGQGLNGVKLNGAELNGVKLNGVKLNGMELNGVKLNGTTLSGVNGSGQIVTGPGLSGAVMLGVLSTGAMVPMRVDDVIASSDPEISLYTVSYLSAGTWKDLCGGTTASPVPAMALSGRWDATGTHVADPAMFTFACRGAALAKCVEMGYKPWSTAQECKSGTCRTVSLAHHHQACTRMIRADYCGDGVAHTIDGTPINVWDALAIQTQAHVSSDWKLDAEWGVSGAVCVKDLRMNLGSVTSEYIDEHCPSRWSAPDFSCFGSGSTFFTNKGFSTPTTSRPLLRNAFDYPYVYEAINGIDGDDDDDDD